MVSNFNAPDLQENSMCDNPVPSEKVGKRTLALGYAERPTTNPFPGGTKVPLASIACFDVEPPPSRIILQLETSSVSEVRLNNSIHCP